MTYQKAGAISFARAQLGERVRRIGVAQGITTAMAAGSIIGATLGGLAVAYAPVAFLKVLLGCVLLAAAGKTAFPAHKS